MELSPRYEGPPVLRAEGSVTDIATPLARQRRRFVEWLRTLDAAGWAAPSRCDGWSVQDVVSHLIGTDQFWVMSASGALAGQPTTFLVGFDPASTPAAMVGAMQDLTPDDVLTRFADGTEALIGVLSGLDEAQWQLPADAPPGHIPLHLMAHHALWDAWIHERDAMLPSGETPAEEPDELAACLRYAAVLGPALAQRLDPDRTGSVSVEGTDPDVHVVVEVGPTIVLRDGPAPDAAARLAGRTVDLVEGLSIRAPLPEALAPADRWVLEDLARAFDQPLLA